MPIESFIKQHLPGCERGDFVLPFKVELKSLRTNYVITDYGQVEGKIPMFRL